MGEAEKHLGEAKEEGAEVGSEEGEQSQKKRGWGGRWEQKEKGAGGREAAQISQALQPQINLIKICIILFLRGIDREQKWKAERAVKT